MEGVATAIDVSAFTNALTSAVSVGDVLSLLAGIIGIGMGFILMWFGVRKAWRMFQNALTKGRASI